MARKSKPDYDVGYGKPPVVHMYPPGYSGNLKGRPKRKEEEGGARHPLYKAFMRALDKKVIVTEGGRKKRITYREYLVHKYLQQVISNPEDLPNFLKFIERADQARSDGMTGEPTVLHIIGGLPNIDRRHYGKQ